MIIIKNNQAINKMREAGKRLSEVLAESVAFTKPGLTTLEIDFFIEKKIIALKLEPRCKGYMGYKHASCISVNDIVVHGIPSSLILKDNDLVKIDVCASYNNYCADMARPKYLGLSINKRILEMLDTAKIALSMGTAAAIKGNRIGDISYAIQKVIDANKFGILRDFAGHGIGKKMHEDPEVLNYGKSCTGEYIQPGMTFAIEPMITMGDEEVYIDTDGWTVRTKDKSYSTHIEDTVLVTDNGPEVLTNSLI